MLEKIKYRLFILIITLSACNDNPSPIGVPEIVDLEESFYIHVNLNDRSEDAFKVEMFLSGLTQANNIFQFPASMPGIYSYSDAGRYVYDFVAYDANGVLIPTSELSTNQWQFSDPTLVSKITYKVLETFDTAVPSNQVYAMAGTSIENDHVLLNIPMVFGYPIGMKDRDYYLSATYPSEWEVGTALPELSEGLYFAENFDLFADSPFLFGQLTKAFTNVGDTRVNVSTYSEGGQIAASQVLNDIEQVLFDAKAFLKVLPNDHYDFLFHFGDVNAGALEHSYSSVYVLQDREYSAGYGSFLRSICAHEFFHVVTPLNIHSELIEDFNFAEPEPSQHLWLYEGVTEWASDFMQFRNGSMPLDELLYEMSRKVTVDQNFDQNYSLTDISNFSYTIAGGSQFSNVYYRGAFVASLLDIRLLELSGGELGLREVILELIKIYGPENSFSETEFFNILVAMTYPEIEVFINDHIKKNEPLPIKSYYSNIGVEYDAVSKLFSKTTNPTDKQAALFAAWSINL
jgi:predicted metalloprotease with PDZ domain